MTAPVPNSTIFWDSYAATVIQLLIILLFYLFLFCMIKYFATDYGFLRLQINSQEFVG